MIEMIVVIGIVGIVTGIVLANLPQFRNRASLDLVSQDIALTIRQAQVFGLGSRQFGEEFPSFGIYFGDTSDNKKSFILFGDNNGNSLYDGGDCRESEECLEDFRIEGGIEILGTCYSLSGLDQGFSLGQSLNINFKRPNPEPIINSGGLISYDRIKIILQTVNSGETRSVNVWNTGQISVTRESCNN